MNFKHVLNTDNRSRAKFSDHTKGKGMFGSLRRIKQFALRKYPWKRYLLHGVGEIILIVIGLLIALSLNDMVENRKLKSKERIFLADFRHALQLELKDIESNREAIEEWSTSFPVIDSFLNSESPYVDSMDRHFSNVANFVFLISTSRPKFEELKSVGFDLIHDPEIRKLLVAYFELHIPYIIEFESQAKAIREDLRRYYLDHFQGWAFSGAHPDDIEALRKDNRFRHLLRQRLHIWNMLRIAYKGIEDRARELNDLICAEEGICE